MPKKLSAYTAPEFMEDEDLPDGWEEYNAQSLYPYEYWVLA